LKAGGSDRNRVLRKYRVDKNAEQKKYERKERREDLLYNLEVFDEGDRAHRPPWRPVSLRPAPYELRRI
jgi:hypothetical protein